jgi:hypothetical protein
MAEPAATVAGQPGAAGNRLTSANALQLWQQALEQISGLAGDHGALADDVRLAEDGRLVVRFPQQYRTCRDYCDRPPNRARLEKSLEQVVGVPVELVLKTHTQSADSTIPEKAPRSKRERQVEITSEPFVKRAMELFDGDPGRVHFVSPEEITPDKNVK